MSEALAEAPDHSPAFRRRRVANWLPLGITYAALYMGRYNLNVIKGDLGKVFSLDKTHIGYIATAGFWTYAASVIVNGPLADRFGGRRAILIGAAGSALLNLVLAIAFFGRFPMPLVLAMSVLYATLMYFQSFGALSIVKVNAAWFHVRERGVQGGIFGVMISCGYALALSAGGWIYGWSKHHFSNPIVAFAPVFLAPAILLAVVFAIDSLLVRDSPQNAGFDDFHTGDATADDTAEEAARP
ncbi:MAG: MFS transporter, partial [Polyangiales bacterium]